MKTLDLSPVSKLRMGSGIGNGTVNGGVHGETACFVAQAAILDALAHGRKLDKPTDDLECACPLLRRMGIRINDALWWDSDEQRTDTLRPLLGLLIDSSVGGKAMQKRIMRFVDCQIREIAPLVLAVRYPDAAKALAAIKPIVDDVTALEAKNTINAYLAYLADLAYRAYLADLADLAYRADRADRAYLADLADLADLAYRADRAKIRDAHIALFVELAAITNESVNL